MDIERPVKAREIRCPRCGAELAADGPCCQGCGYGLEGARVYNPRHFVWLAVLFSAMVPIYLAASNWGKVGNKRAKRLWLWGGLLGSTLLFFALTLLPDVSGRGALVGFMINVPIGYKLRSLQRPVYSTALRLGARPGSSFKGTILGFGLVLFTLVLGVSGAFAEWKIQTTRGAHLLSRGQFDEAATVFQGILRDFPDDDQARFNLALCDAARSRWAEAGDGFESYLRRNDKDATAYAFLSRVRQAQGRYEESSTLASKARALEPGVFERVFAPGAARDKAARSKNDAHP